MIKRGRILLFLLILVPIGFYSKFYSGPAANWVNNSLNGVFYEIFWCLLIALFFDAARPRVIAVSVLIATCLLEILQLWHPPFLVSIRDHFLGRTILGTTFTWSDFPYYIIGCGIGWVLIKITKRGDQARPMKKPFLSHLLLLTVIAFCAICCGCHGGGDAGETPSDNGDSPTPPWELPLGCFDYMDDWLPPAQVDDPTDLMIAAAVESFTAELTRIIEQPGSGYAGKIRALRAAAVSEAPALAERLEAIKSGAGRSHTGPLRAPQREAIEAAIGFVGTLLSMLAEAREPEAAVSPGREVGAGDFFMDLDDAVLDRYWMYVHWTEILAGYYDDSEHTAVFEEAGRTGFIAEEVGEAGIEMVMDYWRVREEVWSDPGLSDNERLMWAKYTLWDNPHWGDQVYVSDYWRMEPAFIDEDCPLFTGNMMGALAFEYGLTRLPRTLSRMQAMVRALRLFDRFALDSGHPLDQEEVYDGRIQRGPKTKNLYHADEVDLLTVESWNPLRFSHNNSSPDRLTGRERKNVSRDQYYGVFLGYYAAFQVLSAMEDRTPEEEELLCGVLIHMDKMLHYLLSNRLRPGWGIMYNLYSLFEGSCANPPNLTFMSLWAYPGYEEMTGRDYSSRFGMGNRLVHALLGLGRLIGGVELSQQLFGDAHSGLTALNQYMITLYMSDLSCEEWQFIYPPEVLVEHPERRRLWRRMIALFYRKYGHFGNEVFRGVIEEMLLEEHNPPPSLDDISWSVQHGYAHVEPQAKLENFLLPLATVAGAAANREEVAEAFRNRYGELVEGGRITFEGTDLPHGP